MEKVEGKSEETLSGGGAGIERPREYVGGVRRGIGMIDLTLRIVAAAGTLASAVAMGTTNQTLPFFSQFSSQFVLFSAQYNDLPSFTFFVIANSIACGYLVLSLPLAIYHIITPSARATRIILLIFDTVMLALITSGASAAAAIVYLAYNGNAKADWSAICQQFDSFCSRISGSLIGSFGASLFLILIVILITSSIATSKT